MVHIQRHGVPENQQLHQRRQEQQDPHAGLAQRLNEFLPQNHPQSFPHYATFWFILRTAMRKIRNPYSNRNPISTHSSRNPIPLRNTPFTIVTK